MPVNKQLHFRVFRLEWKTILQYLPDIILWYYIVPYWRTVFILLHLTYDYPTLGALLTTLKN